MMPTSEEEFLNMTSDQVFKLSHAIAEELLRNPDSVETNSTLFDFIQGPHQALSDKLVSLVEELQIAHDALPKLPEFSAYRSMLLQIHNQICTIGQEDAEAVFYFITRGTKAMSDYIPTPPEDSLYDDDQTPEG